MTENTINNFAKAFIEAQKRMLSATKDSKSHHGKYADLSSVRDACVPSLNEAGIAVMQPIVQVEGKNFVKTILLHESGESMEGLTEIIYTKQNDAQAQGSGITYARRYGLQSLVALSAEDDDGNKAVETPKSIITTISKEEAISLEKKIEEAEMDKIDFCQLLKIEGIPSLPQSKLKQTLISLERKIAENKIKENMGSCQLLKIEGIPSLPQSKLKKGGD